jgi:NTP pyrophosphatase (non-canonical NTP hydrolase)
MLRDYFPSTNEGAAVYGGFLNDDNSFCRTFSLKGDLKESIKEINVFLLENGYEQATTDQFDETNSYTNSPVTITPHGYEEEFVLFISRDLTALSQFHFITNELKKFRNERDWEQFHNAKDLSIALSIEANELLEQFLWKKADEANEEKIKEELADVFSFALLLADKYKLDVEKIILDKIKSNEVKYPVNKAKGTAKKYNEL